MLEIWATKLSCVKLYRNSPRNLPDQGLPEFTRIMKKEVVLTKKNIPVKILFALSGGVVELAFGRGGKVGTLL